jgi:hypothetical protein
MTAQPTELSWRDGDIYFWRYREEPLRGYTLRCCARKAIVCDAILIDIYSAYIVDHKVSVYRGRRWSRTIAASLLDLEYKGNLDEFDAIADYNEPLYDEADILDLHPSSPKQIFLRKGAVRSKDRMLERCRYLREKAESALRSAQRDVDRYAETGAKIEAGADLMEIYL